MIEAPAVEGMSRTEARKDFYKLCDRVSQGESILIYGQEVREEGQPVRKLMVCISVELAESLGLLEEGDRNGGNH